jgi:small-conductance mechanosensitive channel
MHVSMEVFGIRLVGFNELNAQRLLMTIIVLIVLMGLKSLSRLAIRKFISAHDQLAVRFWARQGVSLVFAIVTTILLLSIWFRDPARLATGLGLVTAGLAFALQKVITSFAGYLLIMRGGTFSVGDRISMGGIRGDVVTLGFMQTTILEMGQPPAVQGAEPAMWVKSRQFTGRIVTVTNDKIFEEPVYNYTRDFPFIWEEITIPVKYTADYSAVEKLMEACACRHSEEIMEMSESDRLKLENRYGVKFDDTLPRVFMRLTDNWLELSVRFLVRDHAIRITNDRISRDILKGLESLGVEVASSTFEVVGMPSLQLRPQEFPAGSEKIRPREAH